MIENEGFIYRIVNVDGVINYAKSSGVSANGQDFQNHIHFNCKECHSLTCIVNVFPKFSLPEGYTIQECNFIVSGICPKCTQICKIVKIKK